jgi:hypothetical protein
MSEPECFFAYLGGCEPQTMVQAHLVPKSVIRLELLYSSERSRRDREAYWREALRDPRCWRWMCGGVSKINGHHGQYDSYQIRLHAWPEDFLEFLREHDLEWMADKYATESTRRA